MKGIIPIGLTVLLSASSLLLLGMGRQPVPFVNSKAAATDDKPVPPQPDTSSLIEFYTLREGKGGPYNFGPTGYNVGEYELVYGELLDRMHYDGEGDEKLPDPALMAAISYAVDDAHGTNLQAEERKKTTVPGELINTQLEALMADPDYRERLYESLKAEFESAEVTVEDIRAYTSMMWMVPDGYPTHPAVTVKDSNHEGGHALVFRWENGDMLRLRMECGYQPMDISVSTAKKEPPSTTPPSTTPPKETTTNPPPTSTTLTPKDTSQGVKVDKDPNNAPSKEGAKEAEKTPTEKPVWSETPKTSEAKTSGTPKETVTKNGKDYTVDSASPSSSGFSPQNEVVSTTPPNAAVANDPVNTGKSPSLDDIAKALG